MIRKILGVVAGYVVWTILWLGTDQLMIMLFPKWYGVQPMGLEAAYYGAPPGWIGQRVQVQWNDLHVRLLAPKTGQLLREHLRAPRGWHRLHDDDRPARTPSVKTRR